ncbi:MAG: PEP-utilizing enzyme [Acidimicrobiales bacterium]
MELEFEPPGPGPWVQDLAHVPAPVSAIVAELFPPGMTRGFAESFARWGALLDTLAIASVNGYVYQQPQPFDMPGPNGPPSPEKIGSEIEARTRVAAEMLESKGWTSVLAQWDNEIKPASIARNRALRDVDPGELDDKGLHQHLANCIENCREMSYQHHRFNLSSFLPPSGFALQASEWSGEPPTQVLAAFSGFSPSSSVLPPELVPAVDALRADQDSQSILAGAENAADRLNALRKRVPEVEEYVAAVGCRLLEGFDVTAPTVGEHPEAVLGRLTTALNVDPEEAKNRADEYVASIRVRVPAEHQSEFDEALEDARLVYRLRDERGLYSDVPAYGVLRLAMLEIAERSLRAGVISEIDDVFLLSSEELLAALDGRPTVDHQELKTRAESHEAAIAQGAPRYLGPPMPKPPPVDQLPPPLARVMAMIGFSLDGILGQLDDPAGDDEVVVGVAANPGVYEGDARIIEDIDDLLDLQQGEVIVARSTSEAFNSMLGLVGAIVTDHGSFASHAAIVARECGFPAVVGAVDATHRIRTGQRVRVDGGTGEVTILI